jgi:hypothetical protein
MLKNCLHKVSLAFAFDDEQCKNATSFHHLRQREIEIKVASIFSVH